MSHVGRKLTANRGLEPRLRSERVQDGLRKLPGWELGEDGQGIELVLEGAEREAAFDLLRAVLEAAEEESLAPRIDYTERRLDLRLTSHPEGGVTARLLSAVGRLAGRLEGWGERAGKHRAASHPSTSPRPYRRGEQP